FMGRIAFRPRLAAEVIAAVAPVDEGTYFVRVIAPVRLIGRRVRYFATRTLAHAQTPLGPWILERRERSGSATAQRARDHRCEDRDLQTHQSARPPNSPVVVFTQTFSPLVMYSGTWISMPVLS